MQGSTHAGIGFALGAALAVQFHVDPLPGAVVVIGASMAGALLPDIDHANSKISRATGLLGAFLRLFLSHRGFTHSLIAFLLLWAFLVRLGLLRFSISGSILVPGHAGALAALAFLNGYMSHLLADALTRDGIQFAWPIRYRVRLLGGLSVRTGGVVDQCLGLASFLVAVWLLAAK